MQLNNLYIHLTTGCTGWPKRGFDQAPECRPGRPSSSSPHHWRCCYIAAAPARVCVREGPGKKFVVLAVTCCAAFKKHYLRVSVFGGRCASAGQWRAKCAARKKPGLDLLQREY
eukprot:1159464-Pelagomonas_calceolata.AAC.6